MATIGIISHSKDIAQGVKDLLAQMSPDVTVIAKGGNNEGEIGTSIDTVNEIIDELTEDALLFYDIGSAEMNLEMAIDLYEGDYKLYKVDGPIVEGAFLASVSLSTGATLEEAISSIEREFSKKS
ncbi:PTS mannnose transporter subunit IIA [Mammaliicoccus lentus]|jgi:PTS hybrid protein|uniref:dihydroxyacetone kinase phosphoryl donor subunit DhaM n=1 Tax=Mammaliicoccus TaxID=2803850 RepID=UPI0002D5D295|nr:MULTISPECIES: dihydroxyacetone kinase phosphoryl donor subunit DhaM [Mammaliicoccus]MBF0748171.1 PTS-dependent dihydroxyacetone kinase phosphotransferase subunit DhaM [Mammaliicoccus lentus]MBF0794186.1 PTS-dependent dihydroxyacetone kinase phosphotransferase subunit DhaM [Mammaliicoccus lentus]MBW0762096.1 PTS-dependent dihydroxyacetone kinase phosphotransferase subunit DhaM [Mammaliicoccus lentus]MBW0769689.1 PTS-dependent dihydroxyacetone kinase phosphotransferase subunit DhaM [Mammaliico